ncbi:MAG: hypothetical protein WCI73_03040 [Phycisphaerae bacterium]
MGMAAWRHVGIPWAGVISGLIAAVAGWWAERWYWKLWERGLASCYVKVEGESFEVCGIVKGRVRTVAFRVADVEVVQFGRQRLLGQASPLIEKLDAQTLVVRENSGRQVVFQLARVIFSEEDLSRVGEAIMGREVDGAM